MRARFEAIEHTADVGVNVWGRDLSALFEQAARGMCAAVCDLATVEARCVRRIEASAEPGDTEALLVAWLDEVNFLLQTRHEVYGDARVLEVDEATGRVVGEVSGEPIDQVRHCIRTEIKGVTWHGLAIERVPEDGGDGGRAGLRAQVIFDV
jgi:SHS2 domain-containing protein